MNYIQNLIFPLFLVTSFQSRPHALNQAEILETIPALGHVAAGRVVHGTESEELTLRVQIGKRTPAYRFRLVATPGTNESSPFECLARIEISNSVSVVQTIETHTSVGCGLFGEHFATVDINFDGFLDIAVLDDFGAKWGSHQYWMFDQRSGRYVSNALTNELRQLAHNGIEFRRKTKDIEVTYFPEQIRQPKVLREVYRVDGGHLVLIRIEEIRASAKGLRLFTSERIRGAMTLVGVKVLTD